MGRETGKVVLLKAMSSAVRVSNKKEGSREVNVSCIP